MSSFYNFSSLLKLTKAIQDKFKCKNCKQEYDKKWCKSDDTLCFYCHNFLPMRDTYLSILKNIEWYFIKSGEDDQKEYYTAFIENLKKWSNRFHVFPTKYDLQLERELLDD
jgi:hypothetical protein